MVEHLSVGTTISHHHSVTVLKEMAPKIIRLSVSMQWEEEGRRRRKIFATMSSMGGAPLRRHILVGRHCPIITSQEQGHTYKETKNIAE